MRPIKFRAWDKAEGRMYPIEQWANKSWVAIPIQDDEDTWHLEQRELKDIELMQFTGLLDKNGKEIYEGDIVKADYQTDPFEVLYLNACFTARDRMGHFIGAIGLDHPKVEATCEIIGNIYENPELLETK